MTKCSTRDNCTTDILMAPADYRAVNVDHVAWLSFLVLAACVSN